MGKTGDTLVAQRVSQDRFYEKAVQLVREACRQYWLNCDDSYFKTHLLCDEVPVLGLEVEDLEGSYKIQEEEFDCFAQQEDFCVITGKMVAYDSTKIFVFEEEIKVMANCVLKDGEIYFSGIHMYAKHKKVLSIDEKKSPSFYYRKLMKNMCDVLIETKAEENYFVFDEEKYYALFGDRPKFDNMDQWFWHVCENYVLKQDLEKLDLFRDNDIEKRLENEDLIIETTFRIQRGEKKEIVWVNMVIVFVLDITGKSIGNVFVMLNDCTREMEEKISNIEYARTDYLTHISNRRHAEEQINKQIQELGQGTVILFDVDKFKLVNDSFGHITGDDLLIKISKNVSKKIKEGDVFGRLGGDEFVVYLKRTGDKMQDKKRLLEVFEATKFHYSEKGVEMDIHCSAGVVTFESKDVDFDQLYQRADKALYEAKNAGRDTMRECKYTKMETLA